MFQRQVLKKNAKQGQRENSVRDGEAEWKYTARELSFLCNKRVMGLALRFRCEA